MPYLNALCALLAAISFVALLIAFPNDSGGWAVAVAGISCFLIAAYQIFTFAMSLRLRKRFVRGRTEFSEHKKELDMDVTERALNAADAAQFIEPQSVVEKTTELLEPVGRKQKQNR